MGVTGLWKLIDSSGQPVPLETLENKILAIDISIWLHQVVKGFQDSKGGVLPHAHLLGLFHRLCKLLYYRIKPIFVFDGSVPLLKKQTISKRYESKNKYLTEASRIQALLLSSLAKEKVVQQALGGSTANILALSPLKNVQQPSTSQDDMFVLPPIIEENSFNSSLEVLTDHSETFSSQESEPEYKPHVQLNLHSVDITSDHFKNLPADIRHDILTDIKETRKQNSWGRLHELPVQSDDFSSFQMTRLLKRRQVQVSLEEAEKEMGGKCLSLTELENLLTEEGIVTASATAASKHIASDENTRYLLVKDIKKAMEDAMKVEKVPKKLKTKTSNNEATSLEESKKVEPCTETELGNEFEEDLQKAIEMSLMESAEPGENVIGNSDDVKMSEEQKKHLSDAAKGLARAYMMEYGGMSSDDVSEILGNGNNDKNLTETISDIFKYNDKYIVEGALLTPNKPQKIDLTITQGISVQHENIETKIDRKIQELSSETDSDFEDVPDKFDEGVKLENITTFSLHNSKKLEAHINPINAVNEGDNLFADIFSQVSSKTVIIEQEKKDGQKKRKNLNEKEESKPTEVEKGKNDPVNDLAAIKNIDILQQLQKEKENVSKINLNNIIIENKSIEKLHDSLETNENSIATKRPTIVETDVYCTRIFSNDSEEILTKLQKEKGEKLNFSLDDIKIDNNMSEILNSSEGNHVDKSSDIIEISDNEDDRKQQIEKQSVLDNFFTVTPKKCSLAAKTEIETDVPKVASPFFLKRTTKSGSKRTPTSENKSKGEENSIKNVKSAAKTLFGKPNENSKANDDLSVDIRPLNESDVIKNSAKTLKETKSKEELKSMADGFARETKELELERNKQERFGVSITEQMNRDCQHLLKLFGIPYIIAPMEAEAQCAFLNAAKMTDGTITDDSDIWLFGGQTVYKNFFDQRKHVLEFRIEQIEKLFNVNRKKLIQLAMLVGSDYTLGINGVGAVTALEILAQFPSTPETEAGTTEIMSMLSSLRKFREWWQSGKSVAQGKGILRSKLKNIVISDGFPNDSVIQAYLYPVVDDNTEKFSWGQLDSETIRVFTKKTFGWTRARTDELLLPVLKKLREKKSQLSIKNYFHVQNVLTPKIAVVSKRVQRAINKMASDYKSDDDEPSNKRKKKPRGKSKSKEVHTEKPCEIVSARQSDDVIEIPDDVRSQTPPVNARKRKVKGDSKSTSKKLIADLNAASCSSLDFQESKRKTPKIPNPTQNIPQREKEKAEMMQNKLKAIEIFKVKKTQKK